MKSLFIAGVATASVAVCANLVARRTLTVASILLFGAFFSTGFVLALIENRPIAASRISRMYESGVIAPDEPLELTGVVEGEPEPTPDSFYLTLEVERMRVKGIERLASGTVLLLARARDSVIRDQYANLQLHHGARIQVMITFDREEDFRNPGVLPFTEFLERKGYDGTGLIKSPLLIERLDDATVFLPMAWLYQSRARLEKEFGGTFSSETAGILDAALLGNAHNISRGAAERFRDGGTFHVLVISGLQIAFIAGVVFLIAKRFTRARILQFLFATLFLWAYTIAVGGEASVVRAALMFTIAAFAPVVARQPNSLNTIAGAGLVLLVWRPSDLYDPSFQLTFLSVLAIVCVAVPLLQGMQRVGSWRPTMSTPYPPECSRWFRVLSEVLFWSERDWTKEIAASNIRYRLFKSPVAIVADRWHIQKVLRFAVTAVIVSASIQVVLLPALILYFHRVSIASLVLNIFVGILMAALAFTALAAVMLSQFGAWLAVPPIMLAEKISWLMVHLVDPFSRIGAASIRLPHYSGWRAGLYALYFLPLIFLMAGLVSWDPLRPVAITKKISRLFSTRNLRLATAGFLLFLGLVLFHPFSAAKPDGKLHIDFLDVGQGDCAVLTLPDGVTVLIDGGGRPTFDRNSGESDEPFERDTGNIGERVVSAYLWSLGLDKVDYIIATHADADHIDGLKDVARNFKVRGALVARTPSVDPEFAGFADTMRQRGLPVTVIGAGDVMKIGRVAIDVLWPPPLGNSNAPSRNNDSVVLRVRVGEKSFLFTGDIEKEGEALLLTEGVDLHSDVVKVAHHGSRTSSISAFVTATRPSVAVVSVGRTSIFGHPNKEVVERWRASGAAVLTTGEKGTISIVSDGSEMTVSTFVR